jgi:hypothetical protein
LIDILLSCLLAYFIVAALLLLLYCCCFIVAALLLLLYCCCFIVAASLIYRVKALLSTTSPLSLVGSPLSALSLLPASSY